MRALSPRPVLVVHRPGYFRRRAPAARRMAARGYTVGEIAICLRLSRRWVRRALAGRAANGRVWSPRERALMAEMGRAAG